MNTPATVMELAEKNPIVVHPDTPLGEAVDILATKGFAGLPVVDKSNKLMGILTEADLMVQNSTIYLPTVVKLFNDFEVYQNDKSLIKNELQKFAALRVKDVMNKEPMWMRDIQSVEDAITIFSEHHRVNPIPIVDPEHKVVGIVSRIDLLKLLGIPSIRLAEQPRDERDLDKKLTKFMNDFERQFVAVSKFRSHYWLIFSILFTLIGFIIAFALILRMSPPQ